MLWVLVHHFDWERNYYLLFPKNLYKISNKLYKVSHFFILSLRFGHKMIYMDILPLPLIHEDQLSAAGER